MWADCGSGLHCDRMPATSLAVWCMIAAVVWCIDERQHLPFARMLFCEPAAPEYSPGASTCTAVMLYELGETILCVRLAHACADLLYRLGSLAVWVTLGCREVLRRHIVCAA